MIIDLSVFSSVSLLNSTFYGGVKLSDQLYLPEIHGGINIEDCSFYGIQDAAVDIESLSRSLTVEGTTFSNVGTGIKLDGIDTGGDAEFNLLEINADYAGIHISGEIEKVNHIVRIKNSLIAGTGGNGYGVLYEDIDFWNDRDDNRIQLQNVTITNHNQGLELVYTDGNPNFHYKDVQVKNSIIWGNSVNITNADIANSSISYSDVPNSNPASGNIQTEPMFVDPQGGDYHLTYSSPCIDAGDPNSPNDPDGTLSDMGAFYYQMPVSHLSFQPVLLIDDYPRFEWTPVNLEDANVYYDIYNRYTLNGTPVFLATTQSTHFTDMRYIVVEIVESGYDSDGSKIKLSYEGESPPENTPMIYYTVIVRDSAGHVSTPSNVISAQVVKAPIRKETADNPLPEKYDLTQGFPNPFNPTITLPYALPELSTVTIMVYDVTGRRVATLKNQMEEAGYYQLRWNGRNESNKPLPSGMYIIQMTAKSMEDGELFSKAQKVVLLK